MHVLKTNVTDVIRHQHPNFSGHFALQYAGESLIDLLPMKWDGLVWDTQELRGVVRLSNSTFSYRLSPTRSSLAFGSQKKRCLINIATSGRTFHLSFLEPDTRSFFVEKLYPRLLKDGYDPAERLRSRAYWPIKAFHAPNGAACYT